MNLKFLLCALLIGCLEMNAQENAKIFTVKGIPFKMIYVKGGTFVMGAAEGEPEASEAEKPAHEVTLSSYLMGETEVTQGLWQAVMGTNPSNFKGNNQRPVEKVSWSDCQKFVQKLSQMTGQNFRLPTEAEWEYAARGGNKSNGYRYAGSDNPDNVAWHYSNAGRKTFITQPVKTREPNELGLYDMCGNVWEWCHDWYDSYNSEKQIDPTGPDSDPEESHVYSDQARVIRGGGFKTNACQVWVRSGNTYGRSHEELGFRLAADTE